MNAIRNFVLSLVISLAITSTASAVTLYDESVDGDLPWDKFNTSLGTLNAGINTIIGSVRATGSNGPDEFDAFNFTIDTDATYTVSIFNQDASYISFFNFTNQGNSIVSGIKNLTAGMITFLYTGTTNTGNFDYQIDINVPSAVPIPAALPLFGSVLGFVGFISWRRKRKALEASA